MFPKFTFINATFVIGLSLLLSAAAYPSLVVAWITSVVLAASFYAFHERYSIQESIAFTEKEAWRIREDRGLWGWPTLAVGTLGVVCTIFYAAAGGAEFALIIATSVGLTLALRGILPRFFDHTETRPLIAR